MQIHFKGTNYELAPEVSERARRKLEGLKKHLKANHQDTEGIQIFVDLGKETGAHHGGRIWRADINLDWKGKRLHAEATEESIEKAIDKSCDELTREVQTTRDRERSLSRKGGATLKSFLRGFRSPA